MDERKCARRFVTERDDPDIPETRRLDHGTEPVGGDQHAVSRARPHCH